MGECVVDLCSSANTTIVRPHRCCVVQRSPEDRARLDQVGPRPAQVVPGRGTDRGQGARRVFVQNDVTRARAARPVDTTVIARNLAKETA